MINLFRQLIVRSNVDVLILNILFFKVANERLPELAEKAKRPLPNRLSLLHILLIDEGRDAHSDCPFLCVSSTIIPLSLPSSLQEKSGMEKGLKYFTSHKNLVF